MHSRQQRRIFVFFIIISFITLCLGSLNPVASQEQGSKGLKPDEAGVRVNPKRKKRSQRTTFRTPNRFTPRPAPAGTVYTQVGITIWLVDSGKSKGVEQLGAEQTQERLDTNATYTDGDTVRLTIVSQTGGYLYIVDREHYSDGTYGPAILAFPTLKTRRGDNLIQSWEPIQVPAYPSVWRFKPREWKAGETRKVQTSEVLTIIISPKPLIDRSRISTQQLALDKGEFERWQAQWQTTSQQFDMENSVGQVFKAGAKALEQEGAEAPREEELDAQTSYQVAVKPGAPIMITVPLRFNSVAVNGSTQK
jgi:hypothetical protein